MKSLHIAALLIALLLPAGTALASDATAQDVADFKRFVGMDRVLELLPRELAKGAAEHELDPAVEACVVERVGTLIGAKVDANLRELLTHDAVQQWRAFAATAAGAKLLTFLSDGVAASAESKAEPDLTAFKASLSEEDVVAIREFMNSPSAEVMNRLDGLTDGLDDAAAVREIEQACGAPTTP